MKRLLVTMFILLSLNAYSQIVKFVKSPFQAKYRVYVTDNRYQADIWVFLVDNPWEASSQGRWYVVNNPTLFTSKATKLYRVENRFKADFTIWITTNRFVAGWRHTPNVIL